MFCRHQWKILSEITTQSAAEHAMGLGLTIKGQRTGALERKHIQVIVCEKCVKLNRFVEEI